MKIAMFSYNAFVSTETNGWKIGKTNEVLLVQDPEGRPWGTTQGGISTSEMADESRVAIENGWQGLKSEINNLDKIIIYVGSYGAERAIQIAKENEIPSSKLQFIMCDCGLGKKLQTIKSCSYDDAQQTMCECGGRSTMAKLFHQYIN